MLESRIQFTFPAVDRACIETYDGALVEMVHQIRGKLLGLEIAVGLRKLELPGVDFASAKELAASALQAVNQRQLGYAIISALKLPL